MPDLRTTQPPITRDPRWDSIVARDADADGRFWYSVLTTGVYCRPSCPSRMARPENVTIHATLAEAQATGYRPCRRCNPQGLSVAAENAALVVKACRLIEAAEDVPSLNELAEAAQLSPHYFHRLFKSVTGVTPRAYAMAHRAARVRQGLTTDRTVTQALHQAGFASSGRFYEAAPGMLGMSPGRYRAGAPGETLHFAIGQCSLGAILVASSAKGVVAILIGDDPDALARDLQDRFRHAQLVGADAGYEMLVAKAIGLVETPGTGLDLPLDIRGTSFQQKVWQALRQVPVGRTATYSQIAASIGAPGSVRAVAGACAANPLAIAIPCHRVVRTDGSLSGYRWGVERKRALIEREAATG